MTRKTQERAQSLGILSFARVLNRIENPLRKGHDRIDKVQFPGRKLHRRPLEKASTEDASFAEIRWMHARVNTLVSLRTVQTTGVCGLSGVNERNSFVSLLNVQSAMLARRYWTVHRHWNYRMGKNYVFLISSFISIEETQLIFLEISSIN